MKLVSILSSAGFLGFATSVLFLGNNWNVETVVNRSCTGCTNAVESNIGNFHTRVNEKGSPANRVDGKSGSVSKKELEAIRETLGHYIHGSTGGQPKRLKKVFHPDLNLYSIRNQKLKIWSGVDYVKSTKEGKPTGETGKILAIDFENNIAVAKVLITHVKSGNRYVDFFMLLKIEGQWTIVHKMYTRKNQTSGKDGSWSGQNQKPKAKKMTPTSESQQPTIVSL